MAGENRVKVPSRYSSEREVKTLFGPCGWNLSLDLVSDTFDFHDLQPSLHLDLSALHEHPLYQLDLCTHLTLKQDGINPPKKLVATLSKLTNHRVALTFSYQQLHQTSTL